MKRHHIFSKDHSAAHHEEVTRSGWGLQVWDMRRFRWKVRGTPIELDGRTGVMEVFACVADAFAVTINMGSYSSLNVLLASSSIVGGILSLVVCYAFLMATLSLDAA